MPPRASTNDGTNTHTHNLPHQIIRTSNKPDSSAASLITDPENQWHQMAERYKEYTVYLRGKIIWLEGTKLFSEM